MDSKWHNTTTCNTVSLCVHFSDQAKSSRCRLRSNCISRGRRLKQGAKAEAGGWRLEAEAEAEAGSRILQQYSLEVRLPYYASGDSESRLTPVSRETRLGLFKLKLFKNLKNFTTCR